MGTEVHPADEVLITGEDHHDQEIAYLAEVDQAEMPSPVGLNAKPSNSILRLVVS